MKKQSLILKKATAEEAKTAAEQAKHSAEEVKESEKALAKIKLEAKQAKVIFKRHTGKAKYNKKNKKKVWIN